VKRLLLDPTSRSWLEQDVYLLLDRRDLMANVRRNGNGEPPRNSQTTNDIEAQVFQPDNHPEQAPPTNNIRHVSQHWLVEKSFPPVAFVVCILNVAAAVFYILLINDPSPPKWSYAIGYVH
jgi:hypothetical protein